MLQDYEYDEETATLGPGDRVRANPVYLIRYAHFGTQVSENRTAGAVYQSFLNKCAYIVFGPNAWYVSH